MTTIPSPPAALAAAPPARPGAVQRLGGRLSAMVLPNIGAFMAWGLITALFAPTGWLPDPRLARLILPMITLLLPVLIGYTGGRLVHGQRGAVVGAVATMGVVVGTTMPMFLGAMIIGPGTAYLLKQLDRLTADRVRHGFEVLVENFGAGLVGLLGAAAGVLALGPAVRQVTRVAGTGVDWLIGHHLLPAVSLLIEPAKVLFLNSAVNHGVLSPLGVAQAAEHGRSILFLVESNPGPGLGLLLAYLLFGPGDLRPTVPAAIVIQFLGGVHEIYFPYVLMKPRLVLAVCAGGAAGVGTFMLTGAGLVAPASPGSIIAYLAVLPRHGWAGVLLGVCVAAVVSFLVAGALLGFGRGAGSGSGRASGSGRPPVVQQQHQPAGDQAPERRAHPEQGHTGGGDHERHHGGLPVLGLADGRGDRGGERAEQREPGDRLDEHRR